MRIDLRSVIEWRLLKAIVNLFSSFPNASVGNLVARTQDLRQKHSGMTTSGVSLVQVQFGTDLRLAPISSVATRLLVVCGYSEKREEFL